MDRLMNIVLRAGPWLVLVLVLLAFVAIAGVFGG